MPLLSARGLRGVVEDTSESFFRLVGSAMEVRKVTV